ncbi:hypothetical protein BH10ACT1_BH10ACT1_11650 [soil metagenome]
MTTLRARIGLSLSLAVLVALVAAWTWWPDHDGRADLRAVPAVTTTTEAATSTTTTGPAVTTTTELPSPTSTAPTGIEPTRLRVPSLGIDAPIVPVGLAPDRQMEIPPATDVGWYRLGPRPGDAGSAVLAAHVDYGGRRGAFFDLAGIPVGGEVLVDGPDGTRRFVVTIREQVAKAEVHLERYFTAEGPERLTLITCGGAFSRSAGHYQDNLIITATPA